MTPMRRRVLAAVLLGALGTIGIPSTSLATHERVKAREVRSNVYRWTNSVIHLVSPHKVKWKNPSSGVPHNVIFYSTPRRGSITRFNLAPGETKTRKIKKAGTFKYYCNFHADLNRGKCSGMCGRIRAH